MKHYPHTLKFRHTSEMAHYFKVLRGRYHINIAKFIRQAILEKLQRDMPKIREDYEKRTNNQVLPF